MRSGGKGDAIPLIAFQDAPPCRRGNSLKSPRTPLYERGDMTWGFFAKGKEILAPSFIKGGLWRIL